MFDMGIVEKIESLRALEEEYNARRSIVIDAIVDTVRNIGQNPAVTPLGEHMFTIRSSELINAPWSPGFYDWTVQAERLLTLLDKKPILHWAEYIKELLEKSSKGGWTAVTVDKLQLSRKFLQEVADRL